MKAGNGYELKKQFSKFINATFVWWYDTAKTKPYPLTPLISNGNVLSNNVYTNNDKVGVSCFIIYKDLTCGIEVVQDFYTRSDVLLAVGGIQLEPKISFEGFETYNILGLKRETPRIAICYNPLTNKIALAACPEDMHIEVFRLKLRKLGFTLILGLDSGGSAQWKFENSDRYSLRNMVGWLGW